MASRRKESDPSPLALKRLFRTRSEAMRNVLRTIEKAASHEVNLLLLGESGTGKDYLAEAVHLVGPRRSAPFVRIDLAALPEELFEAELFGYEAGAFTDAKLSKIGKLELAQHGTLYFDEIAALTPHLQAKLLRVIQERRFTRLGGRRTIDLDVRLIASTKENLAEMMKVGAFRDDLFYRLNVIAISLPPLRDRREDVAMLARQFLKSESRRHRKAIRGFDDDALAVLVSYDWPGNIRELKNVVNRAVVLGESETISLSSLPLEHLVSSGRLLARAGGAEWTLEQLEREYIRTVLESTAHNYSRAAERLGINRKTLLEKRKKYGL